MDLLREKMRLKPLSGPQDSGGGGNSGTQTQVTELPEWARPAAQKTLAQAEAITDPGVTYQPYDKNRIAEFKPLQEQAFGAAQGLQPSALGTTAGTTATDVAQRALGVGYDPYQTGQFTGSTAAQYMNPYLEQAMAPQLREAQRASDIQKTADQARAVQAGAFGGSRQAIVEAERQRNLGMLQGDIRARGYASAFDQAQQQFAREQQLREQSRQYGAGLGLQGLQTALQGAGMLGQLGGQQFGQQKDIIGLQSQMGAQQQALEQQKLTQDYQDFLTAKKFPYQQVEFMSNILRGTPMGSVSTLFTPPPTVGQQIGAAGMGLYGLGQLTRAGGGTVSSYAEGGSVTSEQFVASALRRLSDAQLQQEVQEAAQDKDQAKLALLQGEVNRRSQLRSAGSRGVGLSSLFNEQMADRVLPTEDSMARGGIVAFADGDLVDDDDDDAEVKSAPVAQQGDEASYKGFLGEIARSVGDIRNAKYTPFSPAARRAAVSEYIKEMETDLGASPYEAYRKNLDEMRGEREGALAQGRGLAALQAASAMLQGRGTAQGLGRAAGAFGTAYGQALAADKAEKRALASMEFNLLDAQRKERMGLNRDARAAADQAAKAHDAAQMFAVKKAQALAVAAGKGATASRPPAVRPAKPAAPPKGFDALAEAEYQGLIAAGEKPGAETRRLAYRNAADVWGRQSGSQRTEVGLTQMDIRAADAATKARAQARLLPQYQGLNEEGRKALEDQAAETARQDYVRKHSAPGGGATAPTAAAPRVNTNSPRPAQTDYSSLWR